MAASQVVSPSAASRASILNAIRRARAGADAVPDAPAAYRTPAALLGGIEQFCAYAGEEAATSEHVERMDDVPSAVLRYVTGQDLAMRVVVGADLELDAAAWATAQALQRASGPVERDGDTLVTGCYAGVAEAGALIMLSSSGEPNEAKFLAATHIAVVCAADIVPTFEVLWTRLRGDFTDQWPRTMNWIVGPSRTADLGVPSKLGAHGPGRVHIIIVDA
jgi:L-lactate dehydrogenase complex protein LldG